MSVAHTKRGGLGGRRAPDQMTVDQRRPPPAPPEEDDEQAQPKPPPITGGPMGRWGSAGMPLERPSDFGSATRRLWERLRPERFRLIAVITFSITGVTLSVLGPRLLGRATDQLIRGLLPGSGGIDFPALHRILLGVVALYLCSASFQYLQAFILAGMVQRTMYRLRSDVEDKLNRLPLSYVDRAARGDLLSRVTNDIDNLAQSLQQTISQLMMSVFMLLGTSIMMLLISPILAIIALVTLPLSTFIIRFIAKRSRGRFIAQWGHTGKLNALVEESLTGHAIVKTFGRQRDVEEVFRETNEDLYEASFGAQFISGTIQPAMIFLGNLNFVAIAVIGGLRVASRAMTIGGIQAFIQYSRQFSQPMQQLASMANLFQSGLASAERVFHLLDADEQSPDPAKWYGNGNGAASNGNAYRPKNSKQWTARWEIAENGRRRRRTKSGFRTKKEATEFAASQAAPLRGRVEFEHVSFSYDPDRPLITDLSLVAEPGRTVAIVGPTGAGKTTLVNLIMRFYELDGGKITLDGRRHREDAEGEAPVEHRHGLAGHVDVRRHHPGEHRIRQSGRDRRADPCRRARDLCRPIRPRAAGRLRHDRRRRERCDQHRREAVADDRARLPFGPDDPDPGRGDEFRRHADGGPPPGSDGGNPVAAHEFRYRAPALDDP